MEEFGFWKETGTRLRHGWWNDINELETEVLRNRYSKVLAALVVGKLLRSRKRFSFLGQLCVLCNYRSRLAIKPGQLAISLRCLSERAIC